MKAATLRDELVDELSGFVAGLWAQLGVSFAPPPSGEQRAVDPEALLLFTLVLGRREPRLLDEALDWLALNESLVSVHRLRGLTATVEDRSLIDAGLDWVAAQRGRTARSRAAEHDQGPLSPLFVVPAASIQEGDPHFARYGWARPLLSPSGKSRGAPLDAPVAFAFRLRRLLGVGVRAEIVRVLLTIRASRVSSKVIAASTGFAQRNVREGLSHLTDAAVLRSLELRDERHYAIAHGHWAALLGLDTVDGLPRHYDWIPAFRALAAILRWLDESGTESQSDYLRASAARTLLDRLAVDLAFAGAPAPRSESRGGEHWDDFVDAARSVTRHVVTGPEPGAKPPPAS